MGVADDGGALRHAISYRIVEADLVQEFLHLRIEGGAAQDNLLELAAEGVGEFRAELLLNHFVQHGDMPIILGLVNEGLELALVHLLHHQRNRDDDVRMHLAESLHDNLGAGNAAQEMHMHAYGHLKEELEHHPVHMGRREHGHHVHPGLQHGAGILGGELDVGVEGPVRNHDTLGKTGSAGGIVDDGQLFGAVLVIIEVLRLEVIGITVAELLVQMFAHLAALLAVCIQELEVVDLHHNGQVRHFLRREALPDNVVHKKDTGFGVVHQVMDVSGFELVQDGDGHGAIGDGGQETHAPVGLVAGADGHFVSFLQTALLKGNVQFGNAAGHIPVGQGHSLEVGQSRAVPVLDETLLQQFVY